MSVPSMIVAAQSAPNTADAPPHAETIGPPDPSGAPRSAPSSADDSVCSASGMAVRLPGVGDGKDGGVTVDAIRSGIDLSHVDAGARPQDDLFGHVNGRWLADYEIPADRAIDGAFRSLFDRAEVQVRDLITEISQKVSAPGTDEQRIGDLYASFLDEKTVEQRGVQPLLDELATIDGAVDPDALAPGVGALQR